MSEEAAADSVRGYWRGLDADWLAPASPELFDFGLGRTEVDSLSRVGDKKVGDLLAGRLWRFSFNPIGRLSFNRVEGFRPGATVTLRRLGPARPRLTLGAGYGIASREAVCDGGLTWPLFTTRRTGRSGERVGRPRSLLALSLAGGRWVQPFSGDGRWESNLAGFFSGFDPNHYYELRGGRVSLSYYPWRRVMLRGSAYHQIHRPLPVATTWNLFGNRHLVPDNLQVCPLTTTAWSATASLSWKRWRLWSEVHWHRVVDSPWLDLYLERPDRADFRRVRLFLDGTLIDRHGDEFILKGRWVGMDRQAPLQWKSFLGDYGTLRGYQARVLAGDEAGWGSLDIRWGFDLFHALRVPLLGKLRLQPITFLDIGTATALAGLEDPRWEDGWRANVGFGFGKLIGVPGFEGNVRLYIAHPVFNGHEREPWRFVLALED